jgi:NAD(P)-dependent dehydrogenase (short-subunit alcohol dehydrogenase family)
LVTGATSGLGQHFAHLLAREGVTVVAAARRASRLKVLCEGIKKGGGGAEALDLDISDPEMVDAVLGDRCFDILINNAGTTLTATALETGAAEFDAIMATNLRGSYAVAQRVARSLVAAKRGGTIINVASILGKRVAGQVSGYATSKAALIQLSRSLALEWARHEIRVNSLCPGYVETELNADFFASNAGRALIRRIPSRRLGQMADLDGALLLLASDLGRHITGTEIVVDGGHLISSL